MSKVIRSTQTVSQPRLRRALEQVRPEMAGISPQQLRKLNIEPLASAAIVRGALPRLIELAPQFTTAAPAFDVRQLNQLETYALALMQAHTYVGIDNQSQTLIAVSKAANEVRIQLLGDVKRLTKRGLIPPRRLLGLKGANGHRNIARPNRQKNLHQRRSPSDCPDPIRFCISHQEWLRKSHHSRR